MSTYNINNRAEGHALGKWYLVQEQQQQQQPHRQQRPRWRQLAREPASSDSNSSDLLWAARTEAMKSASASSHMSDASSIVPPSGKEQDEGSESIMKSESNEATSGSKFEKAHHSLWADDADAQYV